eukprot:4817378-Karenia_brevis.AAC.1
MQDLLRSIRQQGRIAEHTHAGPRDLYEVNRYSKGIGHFFGIPEEGDPWHASPTSDPWATGQTSSSSSASDPWAAWFGADGQEDNWESYVVDDDRWAACS